MIQCSNWIVGNLFPTQSFFISNNHEQMKNEREQEFVTNTGDFSIQYKISNKFFAWFSTHHQFLQILMLYRPAK